MEPPTGTPTFPTLSVVQPPAQQKRKSRIKKRKKNNNAANSKITTNQPFSYIIDQPNYDSFHGIDTDADAAAEQKVKADQAAGSEGVQYEDITNKKADAVIDIRELDVGDVELQIPEAIRTPEK